MRITDDDNAEGAGQRDMRQPEAGTREAARRERGSVGLDEPDGLDQPAAARRTVPPGQVVRQAMPVLHYGPVPAANLQTWDLLVSGATRSGHEHRWTWGGFRSLPRRSILADFHCVTRFTVLGVSWEGVPAAEVLAAVPPAEAVTHVMVWADYGYGANLPLAAFGAADTLLATHMDGSELSPERGYPVRLVVPSRYGWKSVKWVRAIEYMTADRRGFWEDRGYHNGADPWCEQRYSYTELAGEGPPL